MCNRLARLLLLGLELGELDLHVLVAERWLVKKEERIVVLAYYAEGPLEAVFLALGAAAEATCGDEGEKDERIVVEEGGR